MTSFYLKFCLILPIMQELPFISDDEMFYPKKEILQFIESKPYNIILNFISGQSLKYLKNDLPVLVFSIPSPHFENTLKLFKELSNKNTFNIEKVSNSSFKVIQTFEHNSHKDLHLIIQKPSIYPKILISVDRLYFDYKKKQWKGYPQDLSDFYNGTLRIIKPERLNLKTAMNLLVYSSLLNFNYIAPDTREKLLQINLENEFKTLQTEFIRNQFSKIMTSYKPSRSLLFLEEFGILKLILPELSSVKNYKLKENYKNDLFYHCIYNSDSISQPILHLRIAALFKDIGKQNSISSMNDNKMNDNKKKYVNYDFVSAYIAQKILKRLQFPKSLIEKVDFLIRYDQFFHSSVITEKSLRKFVRKISEDELKNLIQFKLYERKNYLYTPLPPQIRKLIYLYEDEKLKEKELKIKDLKIKGEDLKSLEIPPGPLYGKILRYLLEKVKKNELANEKDVLLEEAKKLVFDQEKFFQ